MEEKEDSLIEESQEIIQLKRIPLKERTKKKSKCPNCSTFNPLKNNFCLNCGHKMQKESIATQDAMQNEEKNSGMREMINKMQKISISPSLLLPCNLTEPIYCVSHFPENLQPKDYHGLNGIVEFMPEKTGKKFFFFFFIFYFQFFFKKPFLLVLLLTKSFLNLSWVDCLPICLLNIMKTTEENCIKWSKTLTDLY